METKLPEMIEVSSSNVHSVGYDEENKELYVRFHTKAIYKYHQVPAEEFTALKTADSVGCYMNSTIKKKYAYSKVA